MPRRGGGAALAHEEEAAAFANERGERLAGTLARPSASGGNASGSPPPCVLLAHGYMSDRDSGLLVDLAAALAQRGVWSLRFDFSGNGASQGRFRYGHYRAEARELRAAKAWAEAARGACIVGLVGHSKGATDALLYAAEFGDIARCVRGRRWR